MVRIDHSIARGKKSPPQTGAYIEIWAPALKIFSLKTQTFLKKNHSYNTIVPWKQTTALNDIMSKGKAISITGGTVPHQPSFNRISPKTPAPPCLRGQPLELTHRNITTISSFRCSPIWKSRWRNNKPNPIMIGSRRLSTTKWHPFRLERCSGVRLVDCSGLGLFSSTLTLAIFSSACSPC